MRISHKNIAEGLSSAYILSMPFLSAFAIGPWLPLPLLLGMIVGAYLLFFSKLKFFREDIALIVILMCGTLGIAFSNHGIGIKNINHILAISTSIFFFYICPKSLIAEISINKISRSLTTALWIVSSFILVEFFLSNFLQINFLDFIPYGRSDLQDASFLGRYIRPRGLAEEAGHMALFYELALPISYIYLRTKKKLYNVISYVFFCLSFLLLVSAASIASFIISCILVCLFSFNQKKSWIMLSILICSLLLLYSSETTRSILEHTIFSKLQLFQSSDVRANLSASGRSEVYHLAKQLFIALPFGAGWGSISQAFLEGNEIAGLDIFAPGLISLYLEVLIASGLVGLSGLLFFLKEKFTILVSSNENNSRLVLLSFLSIGIHYAFISNYWLPIPWFIWAIVDVYFKRRSTYSKGEYSNRPRSIIETHV